MKEECVVAIIDMQERLMPAIACNETILQNAIRIVRFARLLNIPVVVTEQQKLGPTLAVIAAEIGEVQPIKKTYFNSFKENRFNHYMSQCDKKTIILAGVEAHICVAQTALHALSYFQVHVLADAMGSRTTENCNIASERMRMAGVTISSTEMFIYEVLQRSGTDIFKSALQLVK
jgi:nicotinamidase-related amidase